MIYEGYFISDLETKDIVVLNRDVQMLSIATLNNKEVTLDLNGYKLNLYEINLNSSILRIIDSSEEKNESTTTTTKKYFSIFAK